MAPSALLYQQSYAALKALDEKRRDLQLHEAVNIILPERPRDTTEQDLYLDGAIGMLGTSTGYLYSNYASWADKLFGIDNSVKEVKQEVKEVDNKVERVREEVKEVDKKVERVREEVKEVDKKVERVREEVKEVDKKVERVREEVKEVDKKVEKIKTQVAKFEGQVNTRFDNLSGIQLNSMRTWLEDPIQPILAPVRVGDEQRYTAAKGFPKTVRDFWALASDRELLLITTCHLS
jgi:chromosome segregation ATPase